MKYYLIPVVDSDILYEGESLKDVFDKAFPLLSKREDERVDILYSTRFFEPIPVKKLDAHNLETKRMYAVENAPTYLLATGKSTYSAREIVTGKLLTAKYPSAIEIRKVTKEVAEKYFNESDYYKKVINYFSHVCGKSMENEKFDTDPFAEVYEGTAYLDGELNGKPFKGEFAGTLKLSKKNRI